MNDLLLKDFVLMISILGFLMLMGVVSSFYSSEKRKRYDERMIHEHRKNI